MKSILVIGMGRFGRHCARELTSLGHDVMAVDFDEKNIDVIANEVASAQIGDSTDEIFMQSLGISDFDVVIVAIGDDFQASLETTCLCKELGAPLVVARAARNIHEKFLLKNGADKVVYPERQMAKWTAVTYSSEHIFDYTSLDDDHAIYEVSIPDSWIGKTILQLDVRRKYNINIMAIKENGKFSITIRPDTILTKNMTIVVVGEKKVVQKCFKF